MKQAIQKFGRFLSAMVMPNIGAFIAWGLITALFIPTGWTPNDQLVKLVGPMITYLLPLLIGYTGGRLVYDDTRGGVAGATATMGVIVGAGIPMFIGAMIMGPLGAWAIKEFDEAIHGKIKAGFEMLVNNFSLGIIAAIISVIGFVVIAPVVQGLSHILGSGVGVLTENNLLPLTSVLVEPAKVLFLNNAINHGVFTPLGVEQVKEFGKSALFLVEANPGPGLGLLLAYLVAGHGNAKRSAPGAILIHFFGGIHEIYFPYVLMNPVLIIGMIAGGITNVSCLVLFHAGLVSPASPGSILAVLAVTSSDSFAGVLIAVAASAAVSFFVNVALLKMFGKKEDNLEEMAKKNEAAKASAKGLENSTFSFATVKKVYTACDAGMGSSAMGATSVAGVFKENGLGHIEVTNSAISNLPSDVDIVITHIDLTPLAQKKLPNAYHMSITDFLDKNQYVELAQKIADAQGGGAAPAASPAPSEAAPASGDAAPSLQGGKLVLSEADLVLGFDGKTKEDVMQKACQVLAQNGAFADADAFFKSMIKRNDTVTTFLGNGIAIPHPAKEDADQITQTRIAVIQIPQSVDWDGEPVTIAIAIAAMGDEHMDILQQVVVLYEDEAALKTLSTTNDKAEFLKSFSQA